MKHIIFTILLFCSSSILAQSRLDDHIFIKNRKLPDTTYTLVARVLEKGDTLFSRFTTYERPSKKLDTILSCYVRDINILLGNYDGIFKSYHKDGSLSEKGRYHYLDAYKSSVTVGKYERFYKNGQTQLKTFYDEWGNPNGKYLEYFDNGKLKVKAQITTRYDTIPKNISSHIISINYDSIKHVRSNTSLEKIKTDWYWTYITSMDGMYIEYYENGQKKIKGSFLFDDLKILGLEDYLTGDYWVGLKNGYRFDQKNGEWLYWNSDGVLIKIENYKEGKLIKKHILEEIENPLEYMYDRFRLYLYQGGELAGIFKMDFK